MDRRPSDRVLEEWDSVTRNARRPDAAPNRNAVRGSFGPLTLVPLVAAALVVAVGVIWLGGREASVGTASPDPTASSLTANGSPPATSLPTIEPSHPAASSSAPSQAADRCTLEARITAAEGAAGSRIYGIELRNTGAAACAIAPVATARLVDGTGRVLAQYESAPTDATIELEAGGSATTDASVSNVCGAPPVPPVTIQLDFGDHGTVTATPFDPTDGTVPPCNGPTRPSEMSIHPWSR